MTQRVRSVLDKDAYTRSDIVSLLEATDPEDIEAIRSKAESVLLVHCGGGVFLRGLMEFSNVCACDCHYCGIRKSNGAVHRYTIPKEEIVEAAMRCARKGYGSMVLQSGERRDEFFIQFVEDVVRAVKERTTNEHLPDGLGVTLCIGEQSREVYERLFAAGAHRYLLRIETSSPRLFEALHPPAQRFYERVACLRALHDIGFQTGTGVMIGLPGQTTGDLADDLLFFRRIDVDMIGMGPYIVHRQTPMARYAGEMSENRRRVLALALLMIAVARITLKDVNIAATTALEAMHPAGRELGLRFGANVVMPPVTPLGASRSYTLYEGKPLPPDDRAAAGESFEERVRSMGRGIGFNSWGDPLHYFRRTEQGAIPLCSG